MGNHSGDSTKANHDLRHFFDSIAPTWRNRDEEFEICEYIIDLTDIALGSVAADIGCGKGVMLPHLLKTQPAKVFAVDISANMLQYARQAHSDKRIEFVHEDIMSAQLPMLDVALMYNVYPHFMDKAALVKKIAALVKTGGTAVIAHGASKERINGCHQAGEKEKHSTALRAAEVEAELFAPYFKTVQLIDNEKLYYIRLERCAD